MRQAAEYSTDSWEGLDMWIVELQPGCWLSDGDGDPPRTLKITNAQRYETKQYAVDALKWARSFRLFPDAKIERVAAK